MSWWHPPDEPLPPQREEAAAAYRSGVAGHVGIKWRPGQPLPPSEVMTEPDRERELAQEA